jgi:DNA-binding Lrp family transcriptional regulator
VSKIGFEPDIKRLYGRMAKKLALDEDTVRKRVERLESTGVIRGWQLVVSPDALALKTYTLRIAIDPRMRRDEAVRKIRLVNGTFSIGRDTDNTFSMGLVCENEQVFRKRVELICELTRGTELRAYLVPQRSIEVEPTSVDWQIIKMLRLDPLVPYSRVAGKLGLSSKTVQRRVTRLVRANVISFVIDVDFGRMEGAMSVSLVAYYADARHQDEVEEGIFTKFEDYVLRVGWTSPSHSFIEFVVPNVHVAQEIADWTRNQKGVKDVKLNFNYDRLRFHGEVLDEIMASRVKVAPALRPS